MERGAGATNPTPSGTVTFLFSDIEGSTQRWDRDRSAMQEAVRVHDRIVREAVAAQGGYVFKTVGDAFCVAFARPEAAAAAALAAQRALGLADFSAVDGLRTRMAINTGTADERDGDYFGPALNRVARLLALAHGGQVLLSSMSAALIRENPPPGASLTDLGEHALKDLGGVERIYQLGAPGLQSTFPELQSNRAKQSVWLVPSAMQTLYFTGRSNLLAQLRQQLVDRHRAALSGLGGAGKSQTAIEYAIRHRDDYPDGVFWTTAETTNGLTSGFVEFANALGLPAADSHDHEQGVKAVLEWMGSTDGWLLMLDDVDDRRGARRFVPSDSKGHILITSRESVLPELGIPRALDVGDLDNDEAVRFLLARTGREDAAPDERAAASRLAEELGALPLALEQAGAYVAETNATFAAYLAAYRKRRVALLERAGGLVSRDTVAVTWAANFEAAAEASAAAADVLRVSAFLSADAIPYEMFAMGAPSLGAPIAEALSEHDDLAMAELLRPLARYSLIRSDHKAHTFGVHRLVQQVVRDSLSEGVARAYADRAVAAIDAALPEIGFEHWAQHDRLVAQVLATAEWITHYEVRSEAAYRILNETGRYLLQRGRYAGAEPLLILALSVAQHAFGPEALETARVLQNVALLRQFQARFDEAQTVHRQAIAMLEATLGPDHERVAVSRCNLANSLQSTGHFAEARALYEAVLETAERVGGMDEGFVATTVNNLGVTYMRQGRYETARPLLERSLVARQRALGPEHPHVAISLNNLAELALREGRVADAEPLFEAALAIRERAFGSEHDDVAESLDGLGRVRVRRAEYDEARQLFERSLEIRARTQGPDHPDAAQATEGLAKVALAQGDHAAAERLFQRAVALVERSGGPSLPEAIEPLEGFADLRIAQGRSADARALLERAVAIAATTYGADHPRVAAIRATIAKN